LEQAINNRTPTEESFVLRESGKQERGGEEKQMKLGICMLVIGLLFAGFGVFLWDYAGGQQQWFSHNLSEMFTYLAIGKGVTVFGGGLAIGGIVRMILKR
jgi:hypothetical protein